MIGKSIESNFIIKKTHIVAAEDKDDAIFIHQAHIIRAGQEDIALTITQTQHNRVRVSISDRFDLTFDYQTGGASSTQQNQRASKRYEILQMREIQDLYYAADYFVKQGSLDLFDTFDFASIQHKREQEKKSLQKRSIPGSIAYESVAGLGDFHTFKEQTAFFFNPRREEQRTFLVQHQYIKTELIGVRSGNGKVELDGFGDMKAIRDIYLYDQNIFRLIQANHSHPSLCSKVYLHGGSPRNEPRLLQKSDEGRLFVANGVLANEFPFNDLLSVMHDNDILLMDCYTKQHKPTKPTLVAEIRDKLSSWLYPTRDANTHHQQYLQQQEKYQDRLYMTYQYYNSRQEEQSLEKKLVMYGVDPGDMKTSSSLAEATNQRDGDKVKKIHVRYDDATGIVRSYIVLNKDKKIGKSHSGRWIHPSQREGQSFHPKGTELTLVTSKRYDVTGPENEWQDRQEQSNDELTRHLQSNGLKLLHVHKGEMITKLILQKG